MQSLKTVTLAATAAVASLGVAGAAQAAPLVSFGFAGAGQIIETDPFTGGSTTTDPNVSITSGLRIGDGLIANNGGNDANSFSFQGLSETGEPVGVAESIADNEFLTFSASANSGFTLDLSGGNVTLPSVLIQGNGSRRPDSFALLSSVTGFTADDVLSSVTGVGFGGPTVTLPIPDTADFESLTGPVEFRVVLFRAEGGSNPLGVATSDGGGIKLDSATTPPGGVILNGEVNPVGGVIPEPASAALLGGAFGLAALRRRR